MIGIAAGNDDVGPYFRHLAGDDAADTRASPRDDGDVILECRRCKCAHATSLCCLYSSPVPSPRLLSSGPGGHTARPAPTYLPTIVRALNRIRASQRMVPDADDGGVPQPIIRGR